MGKKRQQQPPPQHQPAADAARQRSGKTGLVPLRTVAASCAVVLAAAAVAWSRREARPDWQTVLSAASSQRLQDPRGAAASLQQLLDRGGLGTAERVRVLEGLADCLSAQKLHAQARRRQREVLVLKKEAKMGVGELAVTATALASESMLDGAFEEALASIREAEALPGLPPAALAVLFKQESAIHDCAGDFVSALHRFEHAAKLHPEQSAAAALKHLELLRRLLAAGQEMPAGVRKAMEKKAISLEEGLLRTGPWERRDQLPKTYLPGLPGPLPWQELSFAGDWADRAAAVLREAVLPLAAEYDRLRKAGRMQRETECIHENDRGQWNHFEVNAPWVERGPNGCALASPQACAIAEQLRALGMPLLRASYSAVGKNAWLRPHCGSSNGQLKWHLGLRVPQPAGCATLRVANETRSWREGEILAFDDSYEHEVHNDCRSERVVFQTVFVHPALVGTSVTAAGGSH